MRLMPPKVKMPSISFVVARSEPGHVIGCDNRLPWHLGTDLKNFKRVTSNHVVLMGRKTFESIGRPLPNRINVVLSTRKIAEEGNLLFADSKRSALYFADLMSVLHGYDEIFVVGGGAVYEEFKSLVNKVHLTEVLGAHIKGEAFFRYKFDMRRWKLESVEEYAASSSDQYPFRIKVFTKRHSAKTGRSRTLSNFLTPDKNLKDWELDQLGKIKMPKRKIFRDGDKTVQLELPYVEGTISILQKQLFAA